MPAVRTLKQQGSIFLWTQICRRGSPISVAPLKRYKDLMLNFKLWQYLSMNFSMLRTWMDPFMMLLWQVRLSSTWTTQKSSSRMSSHSFKQTVLCGGFWVLETPNHYMNLLRKCSQLLKPGGSIFVTTINRLVKDLKEQVVKAISSSKPPRSTRSWLLAILGAEYVLGLLPRGTHEVGNWSTNEVKLSFLNCVF